MLVLRSLAFNVAFYISTVVQMLLWLPLYFFLPRRYAWFVPKSWASSSLWLQKVLAGTDVEVSGVENLPAGPCIVAPKHQSFWDTIAFLPYIPDALYILKRELMWIPLFGWYMGKMGMIAIDRGSRAGALRQAVRAARERMAEGRQLIIYPEGTRRPPGAEPAYKAGIAELYGQLGLPVVPVAHQAGLYWPRRKFLRYPGTIRARFLPAIEPGLPKREFQKRLMEETERACDAILIEAATGPSPPPMPPTAVRRLKELGVEWEASGRQSASEGYPHP